MTRRTVVGVVAVQGAVEAHVRVLRHIGCVPRLVRRARDLDGVGGLVFPGGESTAQRGLLERAELTEPLRARVHDGIPVLLTCAGLILGCRRALGPDAAGFGWIDVDVRRNGWGRQSASARTVGERTGQELVLIRAPRIVRVGPGVSVLESVITQDGVSEPVRVRQGACVGTTDHPELADDDGRLHAALFQAVVGAV